MARIIMLQQRMMALLLVVNTINVVLGGIPGLNIWKEAIIGCQEVVGPLAR